MKTSTSEIKMGSEKLKNHGGPRYRIRCTGNGSFTKKNLCTGTYFTGICFI